MPPKKIIIFVIPLAVAIIVGMIYFIFFYGKLKVTHPVSRDLINSYSSEFLPGLSLKYPKNYSVQDYSKSFKVVTVSKDSGHRLELFRPSDFGPRTEPADLKEKFSLGPKNNHYSVWMFYPNSDDQTQSELHQIFNSIKIK